MTENDRSNAFELDRRKFLIAGGAGAAALGLAACGGGSSSGGSGGSTSSPQSGAGTAAAGQDGTPKRGGTLRLGITGGSDTDTLDGQNMLNNPDFARCFALFEGLTGLDPQGKVYNRLAESIEPNKEPLDKRFELMREMRQYDYDQGGYIIPYLFPNVDAVSAKVKGIKSSVTGVALNSFDWPNIWMES
jgi:ABC-type oligopeptide transport system substrate-binding subunit